MGWNSPEGIQTSSRLRKLDRALDERRKQMDVDRVPRDVIDGKLLAALDDDDKVAIVLSEFDLLMLIESVKHRIALIGEESAGQLVGMLGDMELLRREAFGLIKESKEDSSLSIELVEPGGHEPADRCSDCGYAFDQSVDVQPTTTIDLEGKDLTLCPTCYCRRGTSVR